MRLLTVSFFAGCCLLFASACGNHQQPSPAPDKTTAKADTTSEKFFPVADYLQSEIRYVDSTPLAIMKCETVSSRTDSSFLKPDEFNRLAADFLAPELSADNLEKNFTENSFGDKTTGYLSFTYSPRDKDQSLRRVDVVVSPGEGFNKVKSIYLERIARQSDTLMIKKMYWQARHSFVIITSLQPPGKSPEVRQLKVVWNNEESD
ncbi:MAG: hypothetical protein J0H74_02145 [Chitinophagaceae bacterium]|nr:hypothetical protein [Chitinophagaceae bacterium]